MSPIPGLVALAAFDFAVVVLVVAIVFTKRSPFVTWSVWLYWLLLAAYPTRFREEYGPAMVQLFRDTARDEYRRGGIRALLAVWLWTLVDFGVSVVRQHRERLVVPAGGESALLRDLGRQWGQAGTAVLSVTTLSVWYLLHLLHLYCRRSLRVWTTLAVVTSCVWVWSLFSSLGTRYHVGRDSVRIVGGSVEVWHLYERGEPVPTKQWHRDQKLVEYVPAFLERLAARPTPWEFSLLGGITGGYTVRADTPFHVGLTCPCTSWRLRFPFVFFPVFFLGGTIYALVRGRVDSRPVVQSA